MSPTLLWLIAGSILCLMEFIFPTAFVAFMMGVSALLVAVVSLILPQFTLQAVLWLLFSTLLIFLARRLFTPRRKRSPLDEATEGETLSEISPGHAGRVLYEGNSWRARCEDEEQAIAAHQKVYILRREGNTLIVVPQNILHS
ncbi:MAG: hypothetical protein BRC34_15190 [Cyanobacteria bacterium QH_1_48_107]|nr:MAG: hypothetical protein BRC34_15190 [Cyanobacteria bacterium QH_1_48_107]